ncbi:MAG: hypothetical protein ACP5KZ_02125 [bacterium]
MKKRVFIAVLFLLFLLQAWALTYAFSDTGKEPIEKTKTILLYQLLYFQKLKKLEYAGKWTDIENGLKTFRKVHFVQSDEKYYRSVTNLDSAEKEKSLMISAFDGDKYQFSQKLSPQDKGVLIFSSNLLPNDFTSSADIFFSLYGFALSWGEVATFSKLREEKRWENLCGMVINYKEAPGKGVVITIKRPKEKVGEGDYTYYIEKTFEILFASDYGYFPLHIKSQLTATPAKEEKSPASILTEEIRVTDIKRFDDIPFPLKLEIVSRGKEGKEIGKFSFTLSLDSLKINREVDEKIFTIPRSGVGMIIDEDTGEVLRQ